MNLNKEMIGKMLLSAAALMNEKSGYLCEIDSKFGDGDHGITIGKIANLMQSETERWADASIKDFIEDLGTKIMGINGGSAGPLYGTLIGGFAVPLENETEIDGPLLKKMFVASRDEMFDITTARIGDKTMMDALIPAVDAALAADGDTAEIALAAAQAAAQGAKASEDFISKFGRAKSYKEQTIGTPDAGAVSTAALLSGFAKALE